MRQNALRLGTALAALVCAPAALSQTYTLDNFENGLRVVQPNSTDPASKYLWGVYIGGSGNPPTTVTTTDKVEGASALQGTAGTGSEMQLHFYTYTEALPNWSNGWMYAYQFVNNPTLNPSGGTPAWVFNKNNRLKFWVKVPPGLNLSYPNHNVEFGTYIRDLNTSWGLAESNNQHYYHYLDLRSHGQWEQVIIDTHPDHQRGNSGNTEVADNPQAAVAGYNYFDMLTRFYFHVPYAAVPGNYMIDGVEFYQETNPENTAQVRSIHAAYIPSTGAVEVGWTRPKNQDGVAHEVRYSFSSIHSIGWANATVPSNSVVADQGSGGYNGMRWVSSGINFTGKGVVYIAIKPQNSTQFRQIAVPLSAAVFAVPKAPTAVTVQ